MDQRRPLTGSASEKSLGIDLTGPGKVLESSTGSASGKSLGIDLTGPEKALDRHQKNL